MAETADEPVEPIRQKTCILKASIHCEGCKRKVKKLLNQIQGVESVDVDMKQQKVTVTGNVDADILVKKLVKSGKHAKIWPAEKSDADILVKKSVKSGQHAEICPQKAEKSEKAEICPQKAEKSEKIHGNGKGTEKEIDSHRKINHPEANPVSDNAKSPEKSMEAEVAVKSCEGNSGPIKGGDGGGVPETKSEDNKCEENRTAPLPAVEKSNGTSGKKKKKKGQSGNIAAPSGVAVAPPPEQRESRNQESGPPPPTNQGPPRGHQYQPYYAPPPQPSYAVSYNTAYPTSSYTTSYYAAPPPYAHAYMHPGPVNEPPPLDPYYAPPLPYDPDLNPRQPLDSFEIFSDENPNGCFVM